LSVAPDGALWVFDAVKHRLLMWRRGYPAKPARSVPLPASVRDSDFAVGRDGTIYVFGNNVPRKPYLWMYALTGTGEVRWKAATTVASSQERLLIGPDGSVFAGGPSATPTWTPLTTPAGRPLPLATQRARSGPLQPLTRDLRLSSTQVSAHEVHFALIDQAHRVVRAWRVTSRTTLGLEHISPAFVGGDLVVALAVTREGQPFRWEDMILRLTATGQTRVRVTLNPRAVWDPDGTTKRTTVTIGADGRLYELRTSPTTGMTVARYSLGAA
jgi:hypothetical protein